MLIFILHLHWLLVARDKSSTMFRAQEAHVNAGCLPLEVTSKIGENSHLTVIKGIVSPPGDVMAQFNQLYNTS